jgi:hypothetical protein
MNMKKLLTFLFALLMISTFSFGSGLQFTWTGAADFDWKNSQNWQVSLLVPNPTPIPAGTATWPGQNPLDTDDYVLFNDGSTSTIINVPSCTIGRLEVNSSAPVTDITLQASGLSSTITIKGGVVFTNLWHVRIEDGCALRCNIPYHEVKIVCQPGVNFWQKNNATFDPALYSTCTTDKGFILEADANGHAEYIQQLNTNQAVKGYCQYFMDINKYHYVSCPITTVVPPNAEFLTNPCRIQNTLCVFDGDYLRKFTNGIGWDNWMGNESCFNPLIGNPVEIETGRGYEYYGHPASPSIHEFYGTFNSGTGTLGAITLPVTSAGWNFVGNPFASSITFGEYGGGATAGQGWTWDKGYTDPVAYWYDNCGPGFYRSYNWNTGIPQLPIPPICSGPDIKILPRGQAFFVHVTNFDGSPLKKHEIKISNLARVFRNSYPIGKAAAENQLNLSLNDASGNVIDYVYFGFRDDGSTEFNRLLDAYKIYNNVTNASQIYCRTTDNIDVSVKVLKLTTGITMYPVYLQVNNTGTYSIDASNMNTFAQNTGILLKDNETNTTVDLKVSPVYTFTATAGYNDARFSLYFSDVLGINNINDNTFKVYSYDNSIYILNNDPKNMTGTVLVYDMIGKQMIQENLSSAITRINTNLNKGFYIVSIQTANGAYNQKVYIN